MAKIYEPMVPPLTARELLDLYYLDARCHLLETAAILDRIERARGGDQALKDERVRKLLDACRLLRETSGNRAERFLRLFSDSPGHEMPGDSKGGNRP